MRLILSIILILHLLTLEVESQTKKKGNKKNVGLTDEADPKKSDTKNTDSTDTNAKKDPNNKETDTDSTTDSTADNSDKPGDTAGDTAGDAAADADAASEKEATKKEMIQNFIQQKEDEDSEGQIEAYIQEQGQANSERMQKLTANTMKQGLDMQSANEEKNAKFDTGAKQAEEGLQNSLNSAFANANGEITPMSFDVNPGSGVVDGNTITPAGLHASLEALDTEDGGDWANEGDAVDDAVVEASDLEDLLSEECYKATIPGAPVSKNCKAADLKAYSCSQPIDAAAYIGVTFDITKGYSMAGFRGKLVKQWCREGQRYKGRFDIPDGMHIQGVYETQMTTETFSSISNYIESMSIKSNAQVGTSAFEEERKTLDSTTAETFAASASLAASGGGFSLGASFENVQSSGTYSGEHTFSNSKKMKKTAKMTQQGSKKTKNTEKMVAKMSINVVRYEMFLREVAPNYIKEGFLQSFLALPSSFFAPGAQQRFQDFIQKYGTHYVKAAKFGGQLSVTKTKESSANTDVSDFRKEAQGEFNSVVGSGASQATSERNEESNTFQLDAGGEKDGNSASISIGIGQSSFDETNTGSTSQDADVTASSNSDAERKVGSTSSAELTDTTKVEAKGGSHMIATSITDLYSTNFRSNLVQWLKSIPTYPKPFDFVFEPITTLMYHLLDDLIDSDCFTPCFIDKEDHCLKSRKIKIGCDTTFGQTSDACRDICVGATDPAAECEVNAPRLLDCWEVLDQKDKFKRKIEALDTAMTEYVNNGGTIINAVTEIPKSPIGCTTDYQAVDIRDPFVFDFGDDESIDWPKVAFGNIQIQFNMKRFYFNNNKQPAMRLLPNAGFFLKFSKNDRRWYTKNKISDSLRPSIGSPAVPFVEMKSADTTGNGNFHLVPAPVTVGDETFVIMRLKQGLFVDLNLKNGDVVFTERALAGMSASEDKIVSDFYNYFKNTLEKMAQGEGQNLGFVLPISIGSKTPFPCSVPWNSGQMFESAPDVQQCIKMTLKTQTEYFFVMASNLADKSTWIYVHQTQTDLCLRKLDRTLEYDEINHCATRYGRMASGDVDNMSEQLFVCMYQIGDLISLSISRPSYDRNQREGAISVINHNIIQNTEAGELLIPRYYAIGGGESDIEIEGMFMTELETLQCQAPYKKEEIGGTFRCVLECDEQCSNHGCKKPKDPKNCYTCENAALIIREPGRTDIKRCIAGCDLNSFAGLTYANGIDNITATITELDEFRDPSVSGRQVVCVTCHHECNLGCTQGGLTDKDCLEKTGLQKCINVEMPDGQCLDACPAGTFLNGLVCTTCNSGCSTCNSADEHTVKYIKEGQTIPSERKGDKCFSCNDDGNYLEARIDTQYVQCIEKESACVTDPEDFYCCPKGFQQSGDRCLPPWRAVGYQIVGQDPFPSECKQTDCQITVGTNFLTLISGESFEKFLYKKDATVAEPSFPAGYFSLQLAWKADECNVVTLEWKQENNPLIKSTNNKIEIVSLKEIKCTLTDPALAALKKVSFSNENFFINCPASHRQETILNATGLGFTGLTLNQDSTADYILSGSTDGLYSFGQMAIPDGNVVTSYRKEGATQFSGEMQLSVHDERSQPLGWSAWYPQASEEVLEPDGSSTGDKYKCQMNCDDGSKSQLKLRKCRCLVDGVVVNDYENLDLFDANCQPCVGDAEMTVYDCELVSCTSEIEKYSGGTITNYGTAIAEVTNTTNLPIHHGCCDSTAIRVFGENYQGNNIDPSLNGIYELIYTVGEHQYQFMSGDENSLHKGIAIIQDQADKTWSIVKDFTETTPVKLFTSKSANCPTNAIDWTPVVDTVDPSDAVDSLAKIAVVCSSGRNACPDHHPFAFNYGKSCCTSPFAKDANTPDSISDHARILKPSDLDVDATSTMCLGDAVSCENLPAVGINDDLTEVIMPNRCRTNLDAPLAADFKALSNEQWIYGYRVCEDFCFSVEMTAYNPDGQDATTAARDV